MLASRWLDRVCLSVKLWLRVGVLFVLCRILELKAGRLICVWQANRGKTWQLTYFLIAVCHRTLYLSVKCGYERLLREYTSDRELICEFVASRVYGCKTECTNEARVVRDEEFAFQPLQQIAVDIRERRRACDHRVVNARQRLDCRRYAHVRVYQRRPLAHQPTVMNLDHAHFGDAIMRGCGTSGFQINKDGVFVQHG